MKQILHLVPLQDFFFSLRRVDPWERVSSFIAAACETFPNVEVLVGERWGGRERRRRRRREEGVCVCECVCVCAGGGVSVHFCSSPAHMTEAVWNKALRFRKRGPHVRLVRRIVLLKQSLRLSAPLKEKKRKEKKGKEKEEKKKKQIVRPCLCVCVCVYGTFNLAYVDSLGTSA